MTATAQRATDHWKESLDMFSNIFTFPPILMKFAGKTGKKKENDQKFKRSWNKISVKASEQVT